MEHISQHSIACMDAADLYSMDIETFDFVDFPVFSLQLTYYIITKYNIYLFKTLIPLESGVSSGS